MIAFSRTSQPVTPENYTTLIIGPDYRLYGSTLSGSIYSWAIGVDGTLSDEKQIVDIPGRIIIGVAFDPASTPDNPIMWFSNNDGFVENPPIFSGMIEKLTVTGYGTAEETWTHEPYIIGLPRSVKDHLVNSIAFGPDGALYVLQGSNSAMGDRDEGWGMRPETLLSGAVLRVDTTLLEALDSLPLDVATGIPEEDGTLVDEKNYGLGDPALADLYDPLAPNAPLTIYASGLRNLYDLVWHSNGEFYIPVNGSDRGGSTPGTPDPLPIACQHRLDKAMAGDYTGPVVPAAQRIATQNDYLVRIKKGGYYGHPNPTRCEWVLNGGNPTDREDLGQVGDHYPIGTRPDRNWRGYAYDFGPHKSPNGIIEYKSETFGGALKGKLLVTRYADGNDIIALEVGGDKQDVIGVQAGIIGFTNLGNPLDVIEDVTNGNLYVASYGGQTINLLRPLEGDLNTTQLQLNSFLTVFENQNLTNGILLLALGAAIFIGGALAVYWMRSRAIQHSASPRNAVLIGVVLLVVVVGISGYGAILARRGIREVQRFQWTSYSATATPSGAWEMTDFATRAPVAYDPELVAEGEALFAEICARCHGADARGIVGLGVNLVESPFVHATNDEPLVDFIIAGRLPWDPANRTGIGMPESGGAQDLTRDQILHIVMYLRVLGSGQP